MPRKLRSALVLTLHLSFFVSACSDDGHPPMLGATPTQPAPTSSYVEDTRQAPKNDLEWTRCDLATSTGVASNVAECAKLLVKVRRSVLDANSVSLKIKRYRTVPAPRGQLWLINGGPGASAESFEQAIDLFVGIGQDLEIYLIDHRGTGQSSPLLCSAQQAGGSAGGRQLIGDEWADCAEGLKTQLGEDLNGFTVTEAAADLGEAIERTRHGNEPVFIYAVSYGTYLAQRYLQLYPAQATGIILDSICSPGQCELLRKYDRGFDEVLHQILDLCGKDAICRDQLGDDPYGRIVALRQSLENGHCSTLGWNKTTLRQLAGFMLMFVGIRDYIPAIIKRVERCSDNDVSSLRLFEDTISGIDTSDPGFSQVLAATIILSELSESPPPTGSDVMANVDGLAASVDAGPHLAQAIGIWPTYSRDEYVGRFAETSVPLLMLNGTLDPQTPLNVASPTGEHYVGVHQHFVSIPFAAHTTLTQSPLDAEHNCGAELARQFLENPTSTLDLACRDLVLPIAFGGDRELTRLLLGTNSPFADVPPVREMGFIAERRRELLLHHHRNRFGIAP